MYQLAAIYVIFSVICTVVLTLLVWDSYSSGISKKSAARLTLAAPMWFWIAPIVVVVLAMLCAWHGIAELIDIAME